MHLSRLKLNPRSRQVVSELNNQYELHRTVMAAFPDDEPGRVLYRLDRVRGRPPELIVQSVEPPDWRRVAADSYLLRPPERKDFSPTLQAGQRLLFRLRANPTVRRGGSRLGLVDEGDQREWLERRADRGGFSLMSFRNTPEGLLRMAKPGRPLTFLSVLYEGALRVVDTAGMVGMIQDGVGSAKAFGFGLLSVAPVP